MKGILPQAAMPDATEAIFCSATPISTNLSGNSFANASERVDSVRSAQSTTTFLSFLPASTNPSPYPFLVGACPTFFKSKTSLTNFDLKLIGMFYPSFYINKYKNPNRGAYHRTHTKHGEYKYIRTNSP